MARPTLHIEFLSEAEKLSLTDLYHHSTNSRQRERCKAILLNHDGYSIDTIASFLKKDRDTISIWLKAWRVHSFEGLLDKARSGRPTKISTDAQKK